MFNRPSDSLVTVVKVLRDAIERCGDDFVWESWSQTWSDTSIGFGGIAGQAFSRAQTVVVAPPVKQEILVYHGGRYAYTVHKPNALFYTLVEKRQLPGASSKKEIAKLEE